MLPRVIAVSLVLATSVARPVIDHEEHSFERARYNAKRALTTKLVNQVFRASMSAACPAMLSTTSLRSVW